MKKQQFYQQRPIGSTIILGLVLFSACLPVVPALPEDGMVLFGRDDPAYVALHISPTITSYPEAKLRLVVFRDSAVAFNHGLRDDLTNPGKVSKGDPPGNSSFMEAAALSADLLTAAVIETRYRRPKKTGSLEAKVSITWIDPENPRGRWSMELPPDRFVSHIHVLNRQSGFILKTARTGSGRSDFTLHDSEGGVEYRLDESTGIVMDFKVTWAGAFIGLEIAYPKLPDKPDRAIMVLDRLQNGRWDYSWSYGDSQEPTKWTLRDDGVLEIRTPGKKSLYDRTGGLLVPPDQKKRKKQARG